MFDLVISMIMIALALWLTLESSRAETTLGTVFQLCMGAVLITMSIPVAMGFSWPFIVIGALAMIITFTVSIILWKLEDTKLSLIFLLLALGNGVILGMQLSV